MARSPNQPLVRSLGMVVPIVSFVVAAVVTNVPLMPMFGSLSLMPSLPVAVLFFWVVYRPDLLTPYLVLFSGLFFDLMSDGPIGVWALTFVVLFALTFSQRVSLVARVGLEQWAGYVFYCMFATMFVWTIVSLYSGVWLNPAPFLIDSAMLSVLYPAMRGIFNWSLRFVGPPV